MMKQNKLQKTEVTGVKKLFVPKEGKWTIWAGINAISGIISSALYVHYSNDILVTKETAKKRNIIGLSLTAVSLASIVLHKRSFQ